MMKVLVEVKNGEISNVLSEDSNAEIVIVDHDYDDEIVFKWPDTQWNEEHYSNVVSEVRSR